MRHVRLIAVADEYDSEPGLAIKNSNYTADGFMADRPGKNGGGLIAHDLLEHVNGPRNIGPVWDELEALGGVFQVRGRHGDLLNGNTRYRVEQNLAGDISRMFNQWLGEAYNGPNPNAGARPHDHDDSFKEALLIARESILEEHFWNTPREDRPDYTKIDDYLALALRLMRSGFRKAQRRYGTDYRAAQTYTAIRDAVRGCRIDYEGQEFTLSYGDGQATIRERYENADY